MPSVTDDCFFLPEGPSAHGLSFTSTDHTRGPWDARAQHAGPPAALIGHVLEAQHPREDAQVVRVTVEILRPVPVARLHVRTEVARGGRRVEMLTAEVVDDDGERILQARAWRIRTTELPLSAHGVEPEGVPGPDGAAPSRSFFREIPHDGYVEAMDVRFTSGGWDQPGPAVAWMRARHPLVGGEPTTPLDRVLIAADSGNGVSASFDGLFINPDLTVYLTRPARGEWVCLQAGTTVTDHGIGLAQSTIHDVDGPIGRGLQSLLLDTA